MPQTAHSAYSGNGVALEQSFVETPFAASAGREQEPRLEMPLHEALAGNWEFTTPFLPGEAGESEGASPELEAFSEITAEMKDELFRESLEQLADEALEAHGPQLSAEYGDRETRDGAAQRLL